MPIKYLTKNCHPQFDHCLVLNCCKIPILNSGFVFVEKSFVVGLFNDGGVGGLHIITGIGQDLISRFKNDYTNTARQWAINRKSNSFKSNLAAWTIETFYSL